MKHIFYVLLLVFYVSVSQAYAKTQAEACMPPGKDHEVNGPIDSWPWGSEVPFPWKNIQGVWMADIDGCASYFTFKVVKNSKDGERILQAVQIDPVSCSVAARGVGYAEGKVVTAVMARVGRKGSYELKVHVFKEADLRSARSSRISSAAPNRNVTVMTLSPLGRPNEAESYKLYKVHSDPEVPCQ